MSTTEAAPVKVRHPKSERSLAPPASRETARPRPPSRLRTAIYDSLEAVERLWRDFEPGAICTVFQKYDYLTAWQHHIGKREGVQPLIAVVQREGNRILAILPLAITPTRHGRTLTWLAQDTSDYLAPLFAADFCKLVGPARFAVLWREIMVALRHEPRFRPDIVDLRKMPETVGGQRNPFVSLRVMRNPSSAHLVRLSENWEDFYGEKRSASTRRRDRTKRKRLGESGDVRMVTPEARDDILATLDTLIGQKSAALARMGAVDIFARPGMREFYRDLATNRATRGLVHVSRLDVGDLPAAVNLGLQFRNRYHYILAGYNDCGLARYGPGAAHLRDLMQRAIEHGFREFDFTIGDERYKFEWSDTEVRLYDHFAAASLRGLPAAAALTVFSAVKRKIKKTPVLWESFLLLRSRIRSVGGALSARLAQTAARIRLS